MDNSSLSQTAALTASLPSDGDSPGALTFLKRRKGLLLIGVLGAIGLCAGWRWFGTAAVLPLLYVLPCAAMMLMCMRGHSGSGNTPNNSNGDTGSRSRSDISH